VETEKALVVLLLKELAELGAETHWLVALLAETETARTQHLLHLTLAWAEAAEVVARVIAAKQEAEPELWFGLSYPILQLPTLMLSGQEEPKEPEDRFHPVVMGQTGGSWLRRTFNRGIRDELHS
jgi:hypothetical protein